jgi:hypothetical protein
VIHVTLQHPILRVCVPYSDLHVWVRSHYVTEGISLLMMEMGFEFHEDDSDAMRRMTEGCQCLLLVFVILFLLVFDVVGVPSVERRDWVEGTWLPYLQEVHLLDRHIFLDEE